MSLIALPIVALALSSGQWTSATVIYGIMAPFCTVEVPVASALVRLDTGATQAVSPVFYRCNSFDGFTRRVTSLNGGALTRGSQRIAYRIVQDGEGAIAIPATSLATPFVSQVGASVSVVAGTSGTLGVIVPNAPAGLFAGEYSDVVTIEITPN